MSRPPHRVVKGFHTCNRWGGKVMIKIGTHTKMLNNYENTQEALLTGNLPILMLDAFANQNKEKD